MSFSRAGAPSSSSTNNNINQPNAAAPPSATTNGKTASNTSSLSSSSSIPRPPPSSSLRRNNSNNADKNQQQSGHNTPRESSGATSATSATTTSSSVLQHQQTTSGISSRLLQPTASSTIRRAASNSLQNNSMNGNRGSNVNNNNNSNLNNSTRSSNQQQNHADADDSDQQEQGPLWISVNKPSPLFAAPNGPQVGETEIGTIIEEYASTIDCFGAEWIASVALNDSEFADGHLQQENNNANNPQSFSYIWVRKYEKGESLQSGREVLWKLKEGENSSNNSSAAGGNGGDAGSSGNVICNPSHAPFRPPPFPPATTDFSLILQYLEIENKKNPSSSTASRDWNTEYQFLIEKLLYHSSSSSSSSSSTASSSVSETEKDGSKETTPTEQIRLNIHKFYSEFADEIGKIGVKVVEELSVSLNSRTVKPFVGASGSIVLGIYFHNGILYRMNVDSAGGVYGGDKNAMKIANQVLKATNFVATAGPLFFFHQPLLMILTFRGFRISASTIPPLRPDGLLAGSMDNGKTWKQPTGFFTTLIEEFGDELGLSPHKVSLASNNTSSSTNSSSSSSSTYTTSIPYDSCIIGGYDQRFYTMNVGRYLPPIAPIANYPIASNNNNAQRVITNLFWRLRPELVSRLDFNVSSDAFVPNASHVEDNEDAIAATTLLRDYAIPSVAAALGFLEPTVAQTVTLDRCAACHGENIQDHLVFSICESECCHICPQCYLQIQKTAFWDNKVDEAEAFVKKYITCGSLPRTLKGFVMTPDISTIMHAHGVNLRYLNMVYQKIPRSAFHCTGHYLEIEMIARTAQTLLSEILRKSADNEEANQRTAHFFVSLLQPSGEKAERFWAEELGPAIVKQYDVLSPFDTERLDRDLVYRRLSELTGVQFSQQSVKSLLTEKPFVQMMPPQPVLKQVLLPNLVESCGDRREYLTKYSGLLQVYWSELPSNEAVKNLWKNKRPLHFEDEEDE